MRLAEIIIYASFIHRITAVEKIYKQETQLNKLTNKKHMNGSDIISTCSEQQVTTNHHHIKL